MQTRSKDINIDMYIYTNYTMLQVSQIACASAHRAPPGCTQYLTSAAGGVKSFSTFNYAQGVHLANQKQIICFR